MTFHRPSWDGHLARQNLSSAIDSPYKRIYHYLQWKQEQDKLNQTVKDHEDNDNDTIPREKSANVTIRNKPPSKGKPKRSNIVPVVEDTRKNDSAGKGLGNETMKSENIVAMKDADGVMVLDRETGVAVKVPSEKQPKGKSIRQKSRSKRSTKRKSEVKKVDSKSDLGKQVGDNKSNVVKTSR